MNTLEAFIRKNTRLWKEGDKFIVCMEEDQEVCDTMIEAQDIREDFATQALREEHKYSCDFCNLYCNEEDVMHRIEDHSFTAPYGSTFILSVDVASVPVCPICQDDMEECR